MQSSNSKNKFDFSNLTKFESLVLRVVQKIPKGKVMTYGQIAKVIGKPNSARAVGNALNKNPFAPEIPCHRVIRSNGETGGFAGGPKKKIKILKKEGHKIKKGKIEELDVVKV